MWFKKLAKISSKLSNDICNNEFRNVAPVRLDISLHQFEDNSMFVLEYTPIYGYLRISFTILCKCTYWSKFAS